MGWQHVLSPVAVCRRCGRTWLLQPSWFCSQSHSPSSAEAAVWGPFLSSKITGNATVLPLQKGAALPSRAIWLYWWSHVKEMPVPLAVLAALCTEKQARQTASIPLSSAILVFHPKWAMWDLFISMVSRQWIASWLCDHPAGSCLAVVVVFCCSCSQVSAAS